MKIAMIILAAGLSKRMEGVFKPLLPVGTELAISRCVRIAESVGVCEIIVVSGHRRQELESVLSESSSSVHIVHNEKYIDGMFSSVYTGVLNLPDGLDGFFLLPVDCCAVSSITLQTLIEEYEKADRTSVTRPKFDGQRGHPPLIPAQFIGDILNYSGESGLKGILRELPTVEIEMPDCGALLDMDTPEDYAKLLAFHGLQGYPDVAQSLEILMQCETPVEIVAHGKQVANVALKIAKLMEKSGARLDVELLESACLLHDIKRMEADHAKAGKNFLLEMGYPQAAIIVGEHMDLSVPVTCVTERELLYLADKLCRRGKIVKLDDTMRDLASKFSSDPEALTQARVRIDNAKAIMDLLEKEYGIMETDID